MDCCGHEGSGGDARFDLRRVADGVHVTVAAGYPSVRVCWTISSTDPMVS